MMLSSRTLNSFPLVLALLVLTSAGVHAQDEQFLVLPQLAAGGLDPTISGEILVVNQGYDDAATVEVSFIASDGQPLELNSDGGAVTGLDFALAAGRSRSVPFDLDGQPTATGYARIAFPVGASVRATLILRIVSGGSLVTQIGVPAQIPGNNFTFAAKVDSASGLKTGLAVANGSFQLQNTPDPQAQGIVVDLINPDGTIRESTVLQLGQNEHQPIFLDELFNGLGDFVGSVSLSAGIDFGVIGLLQESIVLSSLSIDTGPNFAAFDFRDSIPVPLSEVEPNDTPNEAQVLTLPARIQGAISVVAEADFFQIQATAGQILTAYTVTQNSLLDSYLTLETPAQALPPQALNDQNGLLVRSDSFLRMRISADGTYLLRIEDFFFDGSLSHTYELLVRLD